MVSCGYDNIVLTSVIAEIREHSIVTRLEKNKEY